VLAAVLEDGGKRVPLVEDVVDDQHHASRQRAAGPRDPVDPIRPARAAPLVPR
jgi:hypothetical protein